MSAHTPGPWMLGDSDLPVSSLAVCGLPVGRRHGTIVRFAKPRPDGVSFEESYCNARLIAAAPELLEALQALASADFGPAEWTESAERAALLARAAIRKATGG